MHARKRFGFAYVNPLNEGVCVRAGKNLAVKHSGKVDIVGERRAAGDELEPVHLLKILSDDGVFGTHGFTRAKLETRNWKFETRVLGRFDIVAASLPRQMAA
jgi:hypothetical protein